MKGEMDPIGEFFSDENRFKKEREKARKLRDSAWWKRKRGSGVCYYCGKKFPPTDLTMDHLIPLARGGSSTKENLVPCCKDCNNKKKNMMPHEWTEYMDRLSGSVNEPETDPGENPT